MQSEENVYTGRAERIRVLAVIPLEGGDANAEARHRMPLASQGEVPLEEFTTSGDSNRELLNSEDRELLDWLRQFRERVESIEPLPRLDLGALFNVGD